MTVAMIIVMKSKVSSLEERFQTVMKDDVAYGEAKSESKAAEATDRISTGWWLSLEGLAVALGLGKEKPDFAEGDAVEIRIVKAAKG
jgi:hypothetical protein